MNDIAICYRPIDVDVIEIFNEKTLRDDVELINSIEIYSQEIINNGGEIFKHDKNIIATDTGYYFAFYVENLIAAE